MRRVETLSWLIAALIVVGLPVGALGYQYVIAPAREAGRVVEIAAYAPEVGGFQPASIRLAVGEPVRLRFRSHDVTHGIVIGPGLGVELPDIDPGHSAEVALEFSEPGTYTYYCTTWCSADHWRMRGVIEVYDPADPNRLPAAARDPVIEALVAHGVDIDSGMAGHGSGSELWAERALARLVPSPERGAALLPTLVVPGEARDSEWRRTHTPEELVALLHGANPEADTQMLLDAAAALWLEPAPDPAAFAETQRRYNQDCAACHGETGRADGPAAFAIDGGPPAFANLNAMLARRPDVLYAKIRRGGMGTDMPNFGTLYTQDETWRLVDYLWWLAFAGPDEERHEAG